MPDSNMNRAAGSPPVVSLLDRICVVLSHTSHPGNIGATARAMKTMGLTRLILVNPKRFPDPEATARAAGAGDVLAQARVCSSLEMALAHTIRAYAVSARQRKLGPQPLPARQAAAELITAAAGGGVALVFGNENAGLSNDEVQCCQRTVHIPANPAYASLNLAAAVQILVYELRLAAFDGSPPAPTGVVPFVSPLAAHQDVEYFYQHLERVMLGTGFLDPQRPRRLLPKLRRLFARAELERNEINILRGLLDAVERRLPREKEAGTTVNRGPPLVDPLP